ncbi:Uncharacterised protein [Klebsiella pneumoniae]|nr:Uncharacterised protein [Klebsiella pneumoniae]
MNSYAGFIGELFGGFFHGGCWATRTIYLYVCKAMDG